MDRLSLLGALGCISAALCAALTFQVASDAFAGAARSARLQRRAGASNGVRILLGGFSGQTRFGNLLLRIPPFRRVAEGASASLRGSGVEAGPEAVATLLGCLCAALVAGGALASRLALGALLAAAAVFGVGAWSAHAADSRRAQMRDALPDALQSMGSCFGAGFTLLQTFSHLGDEMKGPLAEQFGFVASALQTGMAPTQALERMRERCGVGELSFVAVALAVQHQTGGSMQGVLESTRASLKEELDLRRSLRVHTAQAKLSARVVVGVTIGLVAVMMTLSQGFLDPFFESALGVGLLCVAAGMQVAGIIAVRRLLDVEVA